MKRSILSLAICLSLLGCKSAKTVTGTQEAKPIPVKKIVKNHYKNELKFTTLKARIKTVYENGDKSGKVTVGIRMEKDKTIWLSASKVAVPVAKALITPERVQYYEKLNKTFFDGNFDHLSEVSGAELDFFQVQNLLLGQSVFDLREEDFKASVENDNYVLVPERDMELFKRLLLLESTNFRVSEMQLQDQEEQKFLKVKYSDYQIVDHRVLPLNIQVESLNGDKRTEMQIEFKNVKLDEELRFPFAIPEGYEEIIIE